MPTYEWLGRRSEDMATSMNYNTTEGTDVTGNAFNITTKGNASTGMTVMFNPKSAFAKFIDNIIERQLELSDLEATLVAVRKYKRIGTDYDTGKPSAYRQTVIVVPDSFAPGNEELNSEVTVNWVGARTHGTFEPGKPDPDWAWLFPDGAFVAETTAPTASSIHYKDGDATRSDYAIFFEYTPTV